MKEKRSIAFNRLFLLFILIGLFLAVITVPMAIEEITLGIISGALSLGILLVPMLIMPLYYCFDKEGVTLCYLFVPNERYLWKNVRSVTVEYDRGSFLGNYFALESCVEGRHYFYMEGHIRKSRRTKRLLEAYWDGKVTGYFFEEFKTKLQHRLEKEERIAKQHLTDEIVPMERETRAQARRTLQSHVNKAKQMGLALNYEFLYITHDLEEHNSRPHEGYNYTISVTLSLPDETDEARILCITAELIHVRLSKKAYRGVPDDTALQNLENAIAHALSEIGQKGFENYI